MTFLEAVAAAPAPVNTAGFRGKQALKREHRSQVACNDDRRLTGSLCLDDVLLREPTHSRASRWDYGVGYRPLHGEERAVWVEVHPAGTSSVSEVLKKLEWLKRYLRDEAHDLRGLTVSDGTVNPYVWLSTSSGVHITPNSPQARSLRAAGLDMPRKVLVLP